MSDYYEIRDRVPRAEIDALTVEAVRVWLERNGWTFEAVRVWLERNGWTFESSGGGGGIWSKGDDAFAQTVNIPWKPRAIQHGAWELGKRAHVVIDEIRAIAEWQARCAAWVAPEGNCGNCWTCERELADPWEAPRPATFGPLCPTCGNKRCPRATDHRNACSGPNEPGQKGSRYT